MRYLAALVLGALAALLQVKVARHRTPEAQAALGRAVAEVDRELAADLELMSVFDQTKQAFVLENGRYLAQRDTLEREAPEIAAGLADLYRRLPDVEAAMERRGPAGSIAQADLALIHAWEGDARAAQHALREALTPAPRPLWRELTRRLAGSRTRR